MQITFPSGTRDTIENIINAIGRPVTFVTSTVSGCYNCSLDPVTDTSTDSFCAVCSGVYWIHTWSGYDITAHITWKFADKDDWTTGGLTFLGDGIVKIMYSGPYMDIVDSTDYIVVDGKQANIEKVTLLGVPSINRIILDFKERNKEDDNSTF